MVGLGGELILTSGKVPLEKTLGRSRYVSHCNISQSSEGEIPRAKENSH